MAVLKTKLNEASVEDFIASIKDPGTREDCQKITRLMQEVTGSPPRMWGAGIVGFGSYHYKYASGREGDWFYTGFSPRKQNLTLYLMCGIEMGGALMEKLGKFKTGKSCLYIKRLSDINEEVLRELIRASIKHLDKLYA